jgi:hypothetical protein
MNTARFFVNFTMSEGTSEASAAKKRKLGQRILTVDCNFGPKFVKNTEKL